MLSKLINKAHFIVVISLLICNGSCKKKTTFYNKWAQEVAPATFMVRFETTKGNFDIEAHRAWSPKAVDRLYHLIKSDFYTNVALFRVVPDHVAQFGIHNDTSLNHLWKSHKIDDEKVIQKNKEGTVAFARGGKESRTTQLYINLKNNSPKLDTIMYKEVRGFPVIAKVIAGMDVVKQFYDGYAEQPAKQQDRIQKKGNAYLKQQFPKLDYIKKAYLLK